MKSSNVFYTSSMNDRQGSSIETSRKMSLSVSLLLEMEQDLKL